MQKLLNESRALSLAVKTQEATAAVVCPVTPPPPDSERCHIVKVMPPATPRVSQHSTDELGTVDREAVNIIDTEKLCVI